MLCPSAMVRKTSSCDVVQPMDDHALDRLGAVGAAIDVEVAKRSELGGDLAQATPLSRFGAGRCSRLASATTFGRASRCDLRPSTLPLARLRHPAARPLQQVRF